MGSLVKVMMLSLLVCIVAACKPPERHSKDGRFALTMIEEKDNQGRWLRFQVRDKQGAVIFVSPTRWAAPHRTEYAFDDADRIWVNSSDVGTSVWAHVGETWQEMKREEWQALPVPEAVK